MPMSATPQKSKNNKRKIRAIIIAATVATAGVTATVVGPMAGTSHAGSNTGVTW